ncbi:hypothetical protein CARUB_v10006428mg [Capsella rubella]|uniref:S-protein homolog n=1 Tax=Capsella rubella TaxID=81985 RepID=R0GMA5_9BRAS|nr:hypothetical protein CARUB_v10006428mg [Capsella rubella]
MGKFLLSFFLICISFYSIHSRLLPPLFSKFRVEIKNELKFHKKLEVHCKSATHSFAFTRLNIGQSFWFTFTIFPQSQYWCNLWQGPNFKHQVAFYVFILKNEFIDETCTGTFPNVCKWSAREDGVYVHNRKSPAGEFMFKWDAPTNQTKTLSTESVFDSQI